jgi:UPF0042 nucleotide-binding protein
MTKDLKPNLDQMDTYQQSSPSKRAIAQSDGKQTVHVTVMSFGYKQGLPPSANIIFDVRFLKNPFWVEELRPLNGMRDEQVQQYVMNQDAATEFLESVTQLLVNLLPRLPELKVGEFTIAFGCTGGQHRSATMCEMLARSLKERLPDYRIDREHRELVHRTPASSAAQVED